jgi:nucleoside 2-deoxyribosyltransferase
MAGIASVLETAGYETFLPHRDGIEAYVMGAADHPLLGGILGRTLSRQVSKAIFALDVYQVVEGCDALVLNMNGRVPDEGAVSETAIAFAVGKPRVLYKQDERSLVAGADNSMLLGLSPTFSTVNAIEDIPRQLERVLAPGQAMERAALAPELLGIVARGERIWALMESLRREVPAEGQAEKQLRALLISLG